MRAELLCQLFDLSPIEQSGDEMRDREPALDSPIDPTGEAAPPPHPAPASSSERQRKAVT